MIHSSRARRSLAWNTVAGPNSSTSVPELLAGVPALRVVEDRRGGRPDRSRGRPLQIRPRLASQSQITEARFKPTIAEAADAGSIMHQSGAGSLASVRAGHSCTQQRLADSHPQSSLNTNAPLDLNPIKLQQRTQADHVVNEDEPLRSVEPSPPSSTSDHALTRR